MKVWRFHNRRYHPLDPTGAAHAGGRWNPRGVPVLYTSVTFAGGMLELVAHASQPRRPPRNHVATLIEVPDDAGVVTVNEPYPPGWDDLDDYSASQQVGVDWLEAGEALALDVPSIPGAPIERNMVLNARHPAFGDLEVVRVVDPLYDPRVWS